MLLGALAVAFGIGLMTSAGYLIARAAERPAILSLTTVIVAVRFFGLARPVARYLERVVSHDLAFRVLARLRLRFYERIEPLAPAGLDAYRRGDLVSRMVGDVDTLQTLYLRGLGPPLVAVLAGAAAIGVAAAILPAAAIVLAAGLLVGGVAVVVVSAFLGRASGARASAQGRLSAELVELLRGAPELVVYGREEETLRRFREGDDALARLANRDALAAGLRRRAGDRRHRPDNGRRARCRGLRPCVRGSRPHARGSARASCRSRRSRRSHCFRPQLVSSPRCSDPDRRVLELTDREPAVRDPRDPLPTPPGTPAIALDGVSARYSDAEPPALEHVDLTLEPGRKLALVGPSGVGKTTVVRLLLRFLDPYEGRVTLAGQDVRAASPGGRAAGDRGRRTGRVPLLDEHP